MEVTGGDRPGFAFGCLGSFLALVLVVVVVVALTVGALFLLVVVGALILLGLVVTLVDRVWIALSPRRRSRRDAGRARGVIDVSAVDTTVIEATAIEGRDSPSEPGRDGRPAAPPSHEAPPRPEDRT